MRWALEKRMPRRKFAIKDHVSTVATWFSNVLGHTQVLRLMERLPWKGTLAIMVLGLWSIFARMRLVN